MQFYIIVLCFILFVVVGLVICMCPKLMIEGGARIVQITNLFELPPKIEFVDDVTGEKTTYDTKKDKYVGPESNTQIRTIVRTGSTSDYGRLITIVGKFYRGPPWEITKLLNKPDSEVYSILRAKFPRDDVDSSKRDYNHAYCIYRVLKKYVPKAKEYLDIGCSKGGITYQIGEFLGAKAYGVDILDESDSRIDYKKLSSDVLPFDDNSMDVVTANMTLHHIKDVDKTLKEITRVLKPGGILFIKEHDCWSAVDAMLIDVEHLLYDKVGGDEGEFKLFHYTNYHGWDKKIKPLLKYVDGDYFYLNIKNEMSATRAIWIVYKK